MERTQELLYIYNILITQGKFPAEKIFLDSPLSIKATEIFKKHTELYDHEAATKYPNAFEFNALEYSQTVEDSQKLNDLQ